MAKGLERSDGGRSESGDASAVRPVTPGAATVPDAFARVWPRRFALAELEAWLGDGADALIADVVASAVNAPLWELAERGGKRWRSIVGRLAYRAAGGAGEAPGELFEVVELLQDASLIVDDIEDGASERRGGAAIHASRGLPVALNAANAAYFRALLALRALLPDAQRLRALDMLAEELFAAHLGQALDLSLAAAADGGAPVGERHYFVMVRAKTGALIRVAARLAAIAAGAEVRIERALAAWAGEVGIAYQVRDDVEDLETDAADADAGRLTYPRVSERRRTRQDARALGADARARAAIDDGRAASSAAAGRAVGALQALPASAARDALVALTRRLAEG